MLALEDIVYRILGNDADPIRPVYRILGNTRPGRQFIEY